MIPQQFGVDSGLTTANTNAALSLNPFLNQQTSPAQQSSRLSVRRDMFGLVLTNFLLIFLVKTSPFRCCSKNRNQRTNFTLGLFH